MQSPARHQFWGLEMDDRLRALVAEGMPFSQIGEKLGRTKCSCIGRAHRLGISNVAQKPVQPPKAVVERKAPKKPVERLFEPKQDNTPQPRYEQPEASTTAFGKPRKLMGLQSHHCRWPVSGEGADTLFCCADRESLTVPYCAEHRLVAWRPTPRQNLAKLAKAYR